MHELPGIKRITLFNLLYLPLDCDCSRGVTILSRSQGRKSGRGTGVAFRKSLRCEILEGALRLGCLFLQFYYLQICVYYPKNYPYQIFCYKQFVKYCASFFSLIGHAVLSLENYLSKDQKFATLSFFFDGRIHTRIKELALPAISC